MRRHVQRHGAGKEQYSEAAQQPADARAGPPGDHPHDRRRHAPDCDQREDGGDGAHVIIVPPHVVSQHDFEQGPISSPVAIR